jgi:hypothetical protein
MPQASWTREGHHFPNHNIHIFLVGRLLNDFDEGRFVKKLKIPRDSIRMSTVVKVDDNYYSPTASPPVLMSPIPPPNILSFSKQTKRLFDLLTE